MKISKNDVCEECRKISLSGVHSGMTLEECIEKEKYQGPAFLTITPILLALNLYGGCQRCINFFRRFAD
jgi:hypothetical protein